MREKYESLSAAVLKDLAKAREIKGSYRMKKEELVEAMLLEDERDKAREAAKAEAAKAEAVKPESAYKDSMETKGSGAAQTNSQPYKRPDAKPRYYEKRDTNGSVGGNANSGNANYGSNANNGGNAYNNGGNANNTVPNTVAENTNPGEETEKLPPQYDDAKPANGILEVLPEGYGFIRCENYLPGENDVYVSPSQIRKFNLKTGDIIVGKTRKNNPTDKFGALLLIENINGYSPDAATKRPNFENLTPIFPDERIRLERPGCPVSMRIVDLISPIGKGQRGMIVSQPKAGKTTLLKQVAKSVKYANPDMHLIILLIDERPEEVTDMKEEVEGKNCEVIYSTFDELPEHHKRVSEMTIERAKRLVEHGQDVMILLDSITRLSRAYNLTVPPSGRTLSGGLDPAALHMPKRFFGAARNMREGGSLTVLATALVETGSKMDDVVFEEFKGTGNMELVLDRKLSEKRVFPAIDLARSSTRREDLLLDKNEYDAADIIRKALNGMRKEEAGESILHMFTHTKTNQEMIEQVIRRRMV